DMSGMFTGATAFNQNLGGWDVTSLTSADFMLSDVTLSTTNYDALLNGWNAQVLNSGVKFDGGNSVYCTSEAARTNMITTYSWEITDGQELNCSPSVTFISPELYEDLTWPRAIIEADVSDPDDDIKEVQFWGYFGGGWHLMETDTNGGDGWMYLWPKESIVDGPVHLKAVAVDLADNQGEVQYNNVYILGSYTFGNNYETRGEEPQPTTADSEVICLVEAGGGSEAAIHTDLNLLLDIYQRIGQQFQ
ncbi:MAG TPA: BspA family leucine-rich repeat surface protein, partial [Anaerolineales bacterium]|nr:BspA family leucine-rich repeat surface protein [Anaerolineales bacterium]